MDGSNLRDTNKTSHGGTLAINAFGVVVDGTKKGCTISGIGMRVQGGPNNGTEALGMRLLP